MDKPHCPNPSSAPRSRGWSRRRFLRSAGHAAGASLLGGSAIALMACEKKPPGKKAARRIHLLQWSNFIKEADIEIRRQAEEFEAQAGVAVTVETINANDLNARATAAVESGNGPDIIQFFANQPHLYAGGLTDVDELAEEVGQLHGGYYDNAVEAAKVDGRWKAVPYNIVGGAFAYRKDKFEELGIERFPDTWDELLTVGRRLKQAGMPIGQTLGHTFGDAPGFCYPLLWGFGGKEREADGTTVAINSPETIEAVKYMVAFYREACDEGGLSWDDTSNNRAFLAGTIAATLNGASIYFVARMNADQYPGLADKIQHALIPNGPGGRYHLMGNFAHGVMDYSVNKEACFEFIRFLMARENFEKWITLSNGYSLGPGRHWRELPMWEQDPRITIYRDIAQYGRSPGSAGAYDRLASEVQAKYIVVDLFARAVQGTDTPEEAVAWAEQEMNIVYQRT